MNVNDAHNALSAFSMHMTLSPDRSTHVSGKYVCVLIIAAIKI